MGNYSGRNLTGYSNKNIYLGNYCGGSAEVYDEIIIGNGGHSADFLVGKGSETCLIKGKLYTTENEVAL